MARKIPPTEALSYRKRIEPITAVVCEYLMVDTAFPFTKSRKRTAQLARGLIQYFAREMTSLSSTEIGSAFGRGHEIVLSAHKRFSAPTSDLERKCVRDLKVRFAHQNVALAADAPDPSVLTRISLRLNSAAMERLDSLHRTRLFGASLEDTAKILLAYKLYEMEPQPTQVVLKEKPE